MQTQELLAQGWLWQWGVATSGGCEGEALDASKRAVITKCVIAAKVTEDAQSLREPRTMENYRRVAVSFQAYLRLWGKGWGEVDPGDVLVYTCRTFLIDLQNFCIVILEIQFESRSRTCKIRAAQGLSISAVGMNEALV